MERYQNYSRIQSSGAPAPLATVTVYRTGTLTLVSLFSDNLATPTAKANPFTADSVGYFDFYCANRAVDIVLSGGGIVTPYTLGAVSMGIPISGAQQVNFADLTTAKAQDVGNIALVGNLNRSLWYQNGSGWVAVDGEVYNVQNFGAKGDGVTVDTVAIQAAITQAHTTGGIVFFPPGVYLSGQLEVPIAFEGIFKGSGPASELQNTAAILFNCAANSRGGVLWEDLKFKRAATGSNAIVCTSPTNFIFNRVRFHNYTTEPAVVITDGNFIVWRDCLFQANRNAINIDGGYNYNIDSCVFTEHVRRVIELNDVYKVTVSKSQFRVNCVGAFSTIYATNLDNNAIGLGLTVQDTIFDDSDSGALTAFGGVAHIHIISTAASNNATLITEKVISRGSGSTAATPRAYGVYLEYV